MPTTVVKVIGTGGDYTTLQAWEDAAPANLVTADQIWQGQCKNQAFSGSGTMLTVGGSTTDSTHYKELICQSGASFKDNANVQTNALRFNSSNGTSITGTSGYTYTISVGEDYFRMGGMQVAGTSSSGSSLLVNNQGVRVTQSIFEHKATDAGVSFNSNNGLLQNCLIIGRKASMTAPLKASSVTVNINGCTIAIPTGLTAASAAIDGNYSTRSILDCAFFGCTAIKSGTSTDTYLACGSDVVSPPSGVTGSLSYSGSFQNVADGTQDYRLKSGSPLLDIGGTTSGFTDDIVGTPRGVSPDIGCWELVVAGGTWKTTNGLASASIKSVDGLAKASIKTYNGLTP